MKKHIFIVIALTLIHSTSAQTYNSRKFSKLNVNSLSTWFSWDGVNDLNLNRVSPGFEFPKGSKKFCFYATGLVFVGKYENELRAGGSSYRSTLTPGWIDKNNIPVDTTNPKVRIYRCRKNYMTDDLSDEANDEGIEISELKKNYQEDVEEWPAEKGAPFEDVNKDGKYTYGIDIPGIPGAYQTIWCVCNDFDNGSPNIFYSKFTNVEVQLTAWAYKDEILFDECIFKKYRIINKNQNQTIKEMYLGFFADPDIGDAGDDFMGCDSTYSFGFVYNGPDSDKEYGQNVPSSAVILLQGPIIEDPNSYGIINGNKVGGYKNIGMTSFNIITIPEYFIEYGIRTNYVEYLDHTLRGLDYNGSEIKNPVTNQITKYLLSGNPITKSGWIDGYLESPGDRRFYLSSGPVDLEPDGVQEITIAQLVTQAGSRSGGLWLVGNKAIEIQNAYSDSLYKYPHLEKIKEDVVPEYFYLSQNYPNPFNPFTRIVYELPITVHVRLEVFNVLGEKVDELVNKEQQPGRYSVEFNSKNLSSGFYFYTIRAREYLKSKKMLLIK